MGNFLRQWGEAAYTSTGFSWMALWEYALDWIFSNFNEGLIHFKNPPALQVVMF